MSPLSRPRLSVLVLTLAISASCSTATDSPPAERARPDAIPQVAHEILVAPARVELLALDPVHRSMQTANGDPALPGQAFHGYTVLGTAELTTSSEQRRLLGLVYQGIEASDGMVAACFDPRHGIRVTRGPDACELVICYACLSLNLYAPGHDTPETRESITTVRSVEPAITALFESVGLEIHP